MATAFQNSNGRTYFIKRRLTKTGKVSYVMAVTQGEDCVDEVPTGFEVWESPENGILMLRKLVPSKFSDSEINAIKRAIEANKAVKKFVLDIRGRGDVITIWTAEAESFWGSNCTAVMRFLLHEEKGVKSFEAQRYCFRGSIDDWVWIGEADSVSDLAEMFCPHLGCESFYELPYFL